MLRYLDVPEDVGAALAKQFGRKSAGAQKPRNPKHIPVIATTNGGSTRTTLVPAGRGRYRLQFNAVLRKAAHADVGDEVTVRIEVDLASRDLPIPLEFQAALQRNNVVRKEFRRLPSGSRMQLLRMLQKARAPETLHRRIDRAVEVLAARALRKARKKKHA